MVVLNYDFSLKMNTNVVVNCCFNTVVSITAFSNMKMLDYINEGNLNIDQKGGLKVFFFFFK